MSENAILSMVMAALGKLQQDLQTLTKRVAAMEVDHPDNTEVQEVHTQLRTGFFPEILDNLAVLDLQYITAGDPLAYATGYVTGKLGQPKDAVVTDLPDYDEGWVEGRKVFNGGPQPPWDKTVLKDPLQSS